MGRMVGHMTKRLFWLALLPLPIAACQQRSADDLVSKLLFTANGTFDAQADIRRREGQGLRSVQWLKHPPLAARTVTVRYDSDLRPEAWLMTIQAPGFSTDKLGEGAGTPVNAPATEGTLFHSGRLSGVLLLKTSPQELTLLTRGYAAHHQPNLLPFFSAR